MASAIDKAFEEYKQAIINDLKEKAHKDVPIAMDNMVDELKIETTHMYNSLITQFYLYETKSYIRHWESRPGTKKGSNLYYGFHAIKRHKGKYPYLLIQLDADDMAGGYKLDTPEGVLECVLSGIRWPYDFENVSAMEWYGSYQGKYFSYTGVPYDIYESFFKNFENIATPIFFKKFGELGWE